jgi:uncharacterized protein YkuJ
MTFKTLTEKQIAKITAIYTDKEISWDIKEATLAKYIGKSTRTARDWCAKLGLTNPTEIDSPQYEAAKVKKIDKKKKVYLITSAQSNTDINDKMLDSMELYAKKHDAEILITPLKYSVDRSWHQNHTWAKRTIKYLNANNQDLCKTLTYRGDVKILPTAKYPLSALSTLSGLNSAIYGSAKIHQESHPTLQGDDSKILATTGSLTKSNYTDTKAGKHGEHYHQFGFVVVEIQDNEIFHLRQVEVNKDGSFDDLFFNVKKGKITRNTEIEGIVVGDVHFATVDEVALETTFDLMNKLKPKHVVLEDVFDGQSVNPHNLDDPHVQLGLEFSGKNDLGEELDDLKEKLSRFSKFKNVVIVRSNHDIFLERFLKRDWRKLPTMKNFIPYMELELMMGKGIKAGNFKGVIPSLIKDWFPKYHTLGYDELYYIKHFAVFNHGEKGSNGSRGGGAKNWSKFTSGVDGRGERGVITAHTHTPSRYGNSICVGHLLLPQDYTIGSPSSWMQSNAIVHKSGKAQQIHIIEGKFYTTFK